MMRNGELRLRSLRQGVGAKIDNAGNLGEFDALPPGRCIDDPAQLNVKLV